MADLDFTIPTGVTWTRTLIWTLPDGARRSLASLAAKMDIRPRHGGPVLLALTSAPNGGIALEQAEVDGDPTGVIVLTIPGPASAPLTQNGVYDLKLTTVAAADGEPSYRPVKGAILLEPGVTQ